MIPTLLIGDFILVNKYAYGLRLPVTNTKIVPIGEPERGDVVVFRYPVDERVNFIKRLVGLQPDTARVVRDGKEQDVPILEVGLDETLRVRPGEKIPVDGTVIDTVYKVNYADR